MKKYIFYIIFCFLTKAYGQELIVESGSLSVGQNTIISLQQTSITNNSNIVSDSSSTINFVGGNLPIEIGGSSVIHAGNIKIGGNCSLNTNLDISGNIYFNSGIFDLNNSDIALGGILSGEAEQTRAFSSGVGRIIKKIDLKAGTSINPGNLGLNLIPTSDYIQAEISRGHEQQISNGNLSINRYYTLPFPGENTEISFSYFDAELSNLTENELKIWGESDGLWQMIDNSSVSVSVNSALARLANGYSKLTLFESSGNSVDVAIPNGFSPNGDGENDVFVIEGINLLPNNKLIIINQWGDILYEASPYENNWAGENSTGRGSSKGTKLTDGTYFYILLKEKNDKKTVLKGFVELKTGDK